MLLNGYNFQTVIECFKYTAAYDKHDLSHVKPIKENSLSSWFANT